MFGGQPQLGHPVIAVVDQLDVPPGPGAQAGCDRSANPRRAVDEQVLDVGKRMPRRSSMKWDHPKPGHETRSPNGAGIRAEGTADAWSGCDG